MGAPRVTLEAFINRANKIHNFKYDYSNVDWVNTKVKVEIICPIHGSFYQKPVEIICPVHGSFFQTPAKHIKTGKCAAQGCPSCRYIRQRRTNIRRYGVENPMKKKEFADTNWENKKKNGTCNSSRPEEQMYKDLVQVFGKKMVKRNYNKDARYPFYCDFYIVSHDIFIELNATWFHGKHFFDANNTADVQ